MKNLILIISLLFSPALFAGDIHKNCDNNKEHCECYDKKANLKNKYNKEHKDLKEKRLKDRMAIEKEMNDDFKKPRQKKDYKNKEANLYTWDEETQSFVKVSKNEALKIIEKSKDQKMKLHNN